MSGLAGGTLQLYTLIPTLHWVHTANVHMHVPWHALTHTCMPCDYSVPCTRLQVQHMDWTAGEVAIPEFHCQRCRDHWYGLTHYPCDEELARLIRQGLWNTGQGPVDRDLLLGGRGSLAARDRRHILKEGGAGGGDKLNLPPIVDKTSSGSSLDGSRSGGGRSDGKKGRHITFNMQAEEFVYSREGEEAVTDGRGSSKGVQLNKGRVGEREEPEGSAHQTEAASSLSLSPNIGKSTRREEAGSGERVPEGTSLHQKADHPWQGGPPSDTGGGIPKERGQHRSEQTGSTSSHGDSSGRGSSMSNGDRHHSSSGPSSEDISKFGEGYGRGGAYMDGGKMLSREGGVWRKEGGGNLATGGSLDGSSTEEASSATADSRSTVGAGGQDHHGDRGGWGSDSGEESGDEGGGIRTKPTTTNSDAGKNVRVQGAGFIARASSPTGSEWGDPTHALMFISNTACSSSAGSSLGGRVQSEELGKTHSAPGLLQARPKLTASDFVWGPPLTRAFTFSYHRHLAPTSQPTAANRSTTKPTKRRK